MPGPDPAICVRCILPSTFPGISFNDRGECSVCQQAIPVEKLDEHRGALRRAMEAAIEAARGSGVYDCIVAFSGGKDSSYTLKVLVERYRLRCLAVTVDNGFMSDQARANCLAVTAALGVDFEIFRPAPAFMNRLYLQSARTRDLHPPAAITRASSTCSSCISLINTRMLKTAVQHRAPLIAGGYVAGQVPKDAVSIMVDLTALATHRVGLKEKYLRLFGSEAERFLSVPEPPAGAASRRIGLINPMLTERVTDEAIVSTLASVGWKATTDTGANSTNCRLNDLGIRLHFRHYGFNPYLFEIAEKVRTGVMDRSVGLRLANAIPDAAAVADQARQIGLDPGEIS